MSLTPPINSSFRIAFAENFVYPEVEANVASFFKDQFPMFRKVVDYLNHTITNAIIPGLKDDGSSEQIVNRGTNNITFSGSIDINRLYEKNLTVNFQIKDDWLNWFIMYDQFVVYKTRKPEHHPERVFMTDMYVYLIDMYGNIIVTVIYSGLRMADLPALELNKSNNGIQVDTFAVNFTFNKLKVIYNFNRKTQFGGKQYRY